VPVTTSATGCTTGSRTGRASTTGGTTVSTTAEVAPSAICATGSEIAVTVPAGTTWFTTGTDATRLSATVETCSATGCSRPAAGGAAGPWTGGAGTTGTRFSVTDCVELVTPPNRDDVSGSRSADADVAENVSQVKAAAPARRTGRRARHGERDSPTRTTPSTAAFDDAYSVRPDIAESLGCSKTNRQSQNIYRHQHHSPHLCPSCG